MSSSPPSLPPMGVTNLGNTCYMNAVLQAMAHSPELSLAMECGPHRAQCPVAVRNEAKRLKRVKEEGDKKKSDGTSKGTVEKSMGGEGDKAKDGNSSNNNSGTKGRSRKNGRGRNSKASRGGGKSPPRTDISAVAESMEDDENEFCALCEVERHMARVHRLDNVSADNASDANSKSNSPSSSSSLSGVGQQEAVTPSAFVRGFIKHIAPGFKLGVQEDSHEFLRLLIDAMQQSCKDIRETPSKKQKNTTVGGVANEIDSEYPFQLFRGTVESKVCCSSCQAVSAKVDPFEDIGLEVIMASNSSSANDGGGSGGTTSRRALSSSSPIPNISLADVGASLRRFVQSEELDSGYKCDKCGRTGKAMKESRLSAIPPILTLHLKRFRYGSSAIGALSGGRRAAKAGGVSFSGSSGVDLMGYGGTSGLAKIEGHIRFEQVVDIRPFLTDEVKERHPRPMFCRLFAVVVHSGKKSHSGHYIAYVSSNVSKKEWWKMDDARVTRATMQEVMSAEAYMLFYRVVDHPVAVGLRNEHKTKMEAEAKQAEAIGFAALAAEKAQTEAAAKAAEQKAKEEQEAKASAAAAAAATAAAEKEATETATKPVAADAEAKADQKNEKSSKTTKNGKRKDNRGNGSNSSKGGSVESGKKRRSSKSPPEKDPLSCGEEWAKAKTRLSSSQTGQLQKMEDFIADNVEFHPSYMKILMDHSSPRNPTSEDVVGDTQKIHDGVLAIMHEIFRGREEELIIPEATSPSAKGKSKKQSNSALPSTAGNVEVPDSTSTSALEHQEKQQQMQHKGLIVPIVDDTLV